MIVNPLLPSMPYMTRLAKKFYFNFRSDHQNKFLWMSRLWVGCQKEPIYYAMSRKKKNSDGKGLKKREIYKFV